MTITHSFDVAVARKTSVEQAILLNYFGYWHLRNRGNGHNFRNGRYWSYNKLDAFVNQFPYWSQKQIRTLLGHLEKSSYIVTDNPGGQDRTTWYALTDKGIDLLALSIENEPSAQTGKSNLPNGQMHMPDPANPSAQTGKSICPNGQMIYKDTVTEPITEPLQNTLSTRVTEETDSVPDSEKKEGQAPPPPTPPPQDKKPDVIRAGPIQDPFHFRSNSEKTNVPFSLWYAAYLYNWNEDQCRRLWLTLTDEERLKAMEHTPDYVKANPNKRYRQLPANYLEDKSFNNEIVERNGKSLKPNANSRASGPKIPVSATNTGQPARSGFNRRPTDQ